MMRLDVYGMVVHTLGNPITGYEFIEEKIERELPKYKSIRCGAHPPSGVGNKRPNEKPCGTLPNSGGHRWMHGEQKMSGDMDASSHILHYYTV